MKNVFGICILFFCGLSACSVDTSCVTDNDCFSGERCFESQCQTSSVNNGSDNNGGSNNGSNNGSGTNNGVNNGSGSNNGTTTNNGTSNNGMTTGNTGRMCVVDPFGHTCEEDPFELTSGGSDNDDVNQSTVPWETNSWCVDDALEEPKREFSAVFCANDAGESYRFPIRVDPFSTCVNDRATVKITVDITSGCDPSHVRVVPYNFFFPPNRYDLCNDPPENVQIRCSESNNGLTHVFEIIQDQSSDNQIWDQYIWIEADENVEFDYDVTVEIIP